MSTAYTAPGAEAFAIGLVKSPDPDPMSATFIPAVTPSAWMTRGTCIRVTRSAPSRNFAYSSGVRCGCD